MSVIRVGLTPAVSVPEFLTSLHMIRSHDMHASREFRYMVDWLAENFVTWLIGFLHMCVFTVSEPPIIRGQEVTLKGRCVVQRHVLSWLCCWHSDSLLQSSFHLE